MKYRKKKKKKKKKKNRIKIKTNVINKQLKSKQKLLRKKNGSPVLQRNTLSIFL